MNIDRVKGAGVVHSNDTLEKTMIGLASDHVSDDKFLYQIQEAIEASNTPPIDEKRVCRYQTINMARKDYY